MNILLLSDIMPPGAIVVTSTLVAVIMAYTLWQYYHRNGGKWRKPKKKSRV